MRTPSKGPHACSGHIRTRVAFWECVHEWMPLCPPRFWTRRRGRDGGSRGGAEGNEGGFERLVLFFNGSGNEAGPFGPYVPTCGPFPRAVRFDVVFFKAVFTERASPSPLSRLFSSPKMAETIQHGRVRLFLSRSRVFFLFSFFFSSAKGRSRGIAHSVAPFNLRRILCSGLRLGVHPLRSARERVLREKGNTYHV